MALQDNCGIHKQKLVTSLIKSVSEKLINLILFGNGRRPI